MRKSVNAAKNIARSVLLRSLLCMHSCHFVSWQQEHYQTPRSQSLITCITSLDAEASYWIPTLLDKRKVDNTTGKTHERLTLNSQKQFNSARDFDSTVYGRNEPGIVESPYCEYFTQMHAAVATVVKCQWVCFEWNEKCVYARSRCVCAHPSSKHKSRKM